jgi:hypothetical protein
VEGMERNLVRGQGAEDVKDEEVASGRGARDREGKEERRGWRGGDMQRHGE